MDECGILTTYRGETFVKGAGYIKTYFVPLDENFGLIKKEQSMDYYRINDRNRYYHLKNTLLNSDDSSTEDDISQSSTYDVRKMSTHDNDSDEDINGDNDGDNNINNSNKSRDSHETRTATPNNDTNSHASLEHEVIETRC